MSYHIMGVREHPDLAEQAIKYFSQCWGIDEKIYRDSIMNSLTTSSPLPRFYLMMDEGRIIGSYGLITNDFNSRQDLSPYLCALYIEEERRGEALGAKLLEHGKQETAKIGFDKLYLCTDHDDYYEKYGWRYIGMTYHPWGEESKVYEADTIRAEE